MNSIHVGKRVQSLFKKRNLKPEEFAAVWGKSKQSVYDLFKKEDINTSIIKMICHILNIEISDFFQQTNSYHQQGKINQVADQANVLYAKGSGTNNMNSDQQNEINLLKEKVNSLTEQNKLLREMNEMLKNRDK